MLMPRWCFRAGLFGRVILRHETTGYLCQNEQFWWDACSQDLADYYSELHAIRRMPRWRFRLSMFGKLVLQREASGNPYWMGQVWYDADIEDLENYYSELHAQQGVKNEKVSAADCKDDPCSNGVSDGTHDADRPAAG